MGIHKIIEGGIEIRLRVTPKSSRSEFNGATDDHLKVKLNSPPVEGAANKELIKLLSKRLGIAKSNMTIIRGEKSRLKTVSISTADTKGIESIILELIQND